MTDTAELQTRTEFALAIISDEFNALGAQDRAKIAQDAVSAYEEDGCTPGAYLARIGTGNLASYLRCLA